MLMKRAPVGYRGRIQHKHGGASSVAGVPGVLLHEKANGKEEKAD